MSRPKTPRNAREKIRRNDSVGLWRTVLRFGYGSVTSRLRLHPINIIRRAVARELAPRARCLRGDDTDQRFSVCTIGVTPLSGPASLC